MADGNSNSVRLTLSPAILFLVTLVIIAITASLVVTTSKSDTCESVNQLIIESNRRTAAHRAQDDGIALIALTAREARLAAWRRDHHAEDLAAANTYQRIYTSTRALHFADIPLQRC